MSFFRRLKDRLFKSSSKIDEGLDAIMASGDEEVVEATAPAAPSEKPRAEATRDTPPVEEHETTSGDATVGLRSAEDLDAAQAVSLSAGREAAPSDEVVAPSNPPASTPVATEVAPSPEAAQEHKNADAPPAQGSGANVGPDDDAAKAGEGVAATEPEKRGLAARLMSAVTSVVGAPAIVEKKRVVDDELLEELEELLISTDLGVETAMRVTANLAEGRFGRRIGAREIKSLLSAEVARILEPVASPLPLYPKKPQVILVVGVNGSGKTTTIGKIASQLKGAGKNVMIAAGDTFRAAAVEQLQVWGDRAGVPVFKLPQGSDPASLAFDALGQAQEAGADVLLIDTAGRLQNRQDLMEELAKIVRVIRKKDETAPHNTILVLDATTGQNAISQVEIFRKIADVSGLVMTKLDGTARGGVLVALAEKIGLPIHAIGVGESIEDLQPFDPKDFADALTGADG